MRMQDANREERGWQARSEDNDCDPTIEECLLLEDAALQL